MTTRDVLAKAETPELAAQGVLGVREVLMTEKVWFLKVSVVADMVVKVTPAASPTGIPTVCGFIGEASADVSNAEWFGPDGDRANLKALLGI